MNYITAGELARILGTIEFLNAEEHVAPGQDLVGMEVKCYDAKGERLGNIKYSEGDSYAFYPKGK